MESTIMSLPCDLVSEILTRLPAKSLMRFKSVERSWNTLFKTNSFIRRQKERQMRSPSSSEDRFLLLYFETTSETPKITLLSTCDPPQYQSLEDPISNPNEYLVHLQVIGHCNGIYCLEAYSSNGKSPHDPYIKKIILWNPATRDVKVLPPNPPAPAGNFPHYSGFGASDPDSFLHFKFVKFYTTPQEKDTLVVCVQLYDFNTDSWSIIYDARDFYSNVHDSVEFKFPLGESGAYSNGAYYWLSIDFTYIISFDFRRNKFRKIKTPSTKNFGQIIEANNCIAYIVFGPSDNPPHERIEIWNMKHNWIKLSNIAQVEPGSTICAILKGGTEFLGGPLHDVMKLYNSQGQILRQFQISAAQYHFALHPYVETIAPLSL